MKVQRKGDWLAAKVGDDLLMMSAEKGNYIGLNAVGNRIWELIDQPCEVEKICAQLQTEFAVSPETCAREVQSFLKELEGQGAVAFVAASE